MKSFHPHRARVLLGAVLAMGVALMAPSALAQVKSSGTTTSVLALSAPEGVKLEAWVQNGKTATDPLTMKVNLTAPKAKRVCIAYTGFETIGLVRNTGLRIPALDRSEHKCSEQNGEAAEVFNDSVTLQRRDTPNENGLLRQEFDNLSKAEQRRRTDFRDGYVVVVATTDGDPAIFIVKSPYFAMDAVVLKKSFMGQTLAR